LSITIIEEGPFRVVGLFIGARILTIAAQKARFFVKKFTENVEIFQARSDTFVLSALSAPIMAGAGLTKMTLPKQIQGPLLTLQGVC